MLLRVLDGIDAFLDQLASVDPLPVLLAVLAQLAKLTCTSMAWRNVLAAAYPDRDVRRLPVVGAYRAVAGSTYTTVVSSTLVLSIFDIAAASALLAWAALTQEALPGLGDLPELPGFDFSWLLDHPLAADLLLATLVIGAVVVGIWIHGHVVDFWERVKQAFAVVRRPALYLRTVAFWQAGDWVFRLVAIWF